MKAYLKKYGVRLLVIVLLVAGVLAIGRNVRDGGVGLLSNVSGAIRTPFQKVATAVVSRMEELYGYIYEYDNLKQENERLRAQLADLEQQIRENDQAAEENARLREILNLQQKHTDYVFESAKVVSWNASNWDSSFTISKGADAELAVGDSVVTEYGVLVGTITEVGASWSTVETVVDLDTNIGVLVGAEEVSGILEGDYTLMRSQYMRLSFVAETGQIITGDIVVTSGAGGAYPQGLIVGTVSSVHSEAAGQVEYAVVEPYTKLDDLTQVFIIKDYRVVE
ncbi:MAG: rod shape-determining protein MreC [Oscillospiraceae bacterium]|nr:rod shape-determining protein MreC [Oscillospiraceae bacterium]